MGKDPAVLFYTNDFLSRTFTMSDEQVGKYIRLLCIQHQQGFLTEQDMLNICKTYDVAIYGKFVKDGDTFYNKRMKDEAIKRANYSESRRNNRKATKDDKICETYVPHMEDVNENENVIKDKKNIVPEFPEFLAYCKTLSIYNSSLDFQIEAKYNAWKENKWKDGNNKLIKNWKTKVQNTMPYFKAAYIKPEHTGRVITKKDENEWKKVKAENDKKLAEQGVWDGKLT